MAVIQHTKRPSILLVLEIIYLAALLIYVSVPLFEALSLPWYRNSDEVVIAAEVVKFARFDFQQRFFDIPGTPFMALSAASWWLWYLINIITGHVAPTVSADLFAFQDMQSLYTLMRGWVIVFYLLSIVLIHLLARRFTNAAGACVAATFAALFASYSSYSSFIRTESMGVCLALLAIFLALHAIQSSRLRYYWLAGIVCGIAAAVRYQFIFATLPMLVVLYYLRADRTRDTDIPRWTLRLVMLVAAACIVGALLSVGVRVGMVQANRLTNLLMITNGEFGESAPVALAFIRNVWIALGLFSLFLILAWSIPALRRRFKRLYSPPVVAMVVGSGLGLLLCLPTFIWSRPYLLRSIQFYGTWYEIPRLGLDPFAQLVDSVSFYTRVATPSLPVAVLYIIGAGLAVLRRDRLGVVVILGCTLGLLMHPPAMKSFQHHVLPWIAFFSLLAAYPFGVVYSHVSATSTRAMILLLSIVAGFVIVTSASQGSGWGRAGSNQSETLRLNAIAEATSWIESNLEDGATIHTAYYAFNRDVMYQWFNEFGAIVPASVLSSRNYVMWWSDRTGLGDRSAYVLLSPGDIAAFEPDNKLRGEFIDPFSDPAFEPVQVFPFGAENFTLFRYDLTASQ